MQGERRYVGNDGMVKFKDLVEAELGSDDTMKRLDINNYNERQSTNHKPAVFGVG